MKLSEQLLQETQDFSKTFKGYAERVERLEVALQDALLFAKWVECIGKPNVEVHKHELLSSAGLAIDRITSAIDIF